MGRRWRRVKRSMGRGWDNFKYEAGFKWLQFKDWTSRKWHSFWGVRWNDIRWGRTFFFTCVSILGYISSVYAYYAVSHTYIPGFITQWVWSGWNWFFWMALGAFWLEEVIDAGKEERDKLNPWPKGLFLFYSWVILGPIFMGVLALIASHDFYLSEIRTSSGYEEISQSRKLELQKELAEAEGRSPSGGAPEESDPSFRQENRDDAFSKKTEKDQRSPSRIKIDLFLEDLKERTWRKIFSRATGVENVDALQLRISKAWGWFEITIKWFPCMFFYLLVVIPTYGLQALESRTVTLVSHLPLLGRIVRRNRK